MNPGLTPHSQMAKIPEEKIRVLLVITRLTTGGDTNVVLEMASHFAHHPLVKADLAAGPVPPDESDLTFLARDRGTPPAIIPCLVNHIDPLANFRAIMQLRRHMLKGKYDIVHTHSSVAGVVGRIAAVLAGVPGIVHHVHGWGISEGMSRKMQLLYLGLERLCARFTDRLVVVSKQTLQTGLHYRIGREGQYALIYNGINLESFRQKHDVQRLRMELHLHPESKIVGMIGRLDKQKNPLDFVRAAAMVKKEYPGVQFVIAGDGVLRKDCEQLIDTLNLRDSFFLLGYRNDVQQLMTIMDMTVLSSLWEGLPVVFQESMSAGKPIVANDVGGASDVIIDGETGFLVTPHQPAEMAARILYLLRNDDVCQKMGAVARRHAERFSTGQMLENLENLYRDVASSAKSAVRKRAFGRSVTQT